MILYKLSNPYASCLSQYLLSLMKSLSTAFILSSDAFSEILINSLTSSILSSWKKTTEVEGWEAEGDTVMETLMIISQIYYFAILCFRYEERFPSFSCAWSGKCHCILILNLVLLNWNWSKYKSSLTLLKLIVPNGEPFI